MASSKVSEDEVEDIWQSEAFLQDSMALNTPQSVQPGTTIELLSKYHNFRCESELQNPKGDYLRALINLNFADDVFKGTDDILTLSLVSAAENTAEGFGKELTDILAEVNQLRQAADMPPLENLFHPNQLAVRYEKQRRTTKSRNSQSHPHFAFKLTRKFGESKWKDDLGQDFSHCFAGNQLRLGQSPEATCHAKDALLINIIKAGQKGKSKMALATSVERHLKSILPNKVPGELLKRCNDLFKSFNGGNNIAIHMTKLMINLNGVEVVSDMILDSNSSFTREIQVERVYQQIFCEYGNAVLNFSMEREVDSKFLFCYLEDESGNRGPNLKLKISGTSGMAFLVTGGTPGQVMNFVFSRPVTGCLFKKEAAIQFVNHCPTEYYCLCQVTELPVNPQVIQPKRGKKRKGIGTEPGKSFSPEALLSSVGASPQTETFVFLS